MILAIGGPEKSCKTSVSLTFPKPMIVFEFDVGTVERALRWKDNKGFKFGTYIRTGDLKNLPPLDKILTEKLDIYILRYPKPLGFGPRPVGPIWQQYVKDFSMFLEAKDVPSGSVDTASSNWKICHTAYLQELPPSEYGPRVSLKQVEYGEPNSRMAALLDGVRNCDVAAKMYDWPCGGKHLVLPHHFTDVYAPQLTPKGIENMPTGELKLEGFRRIGDLIDVEMWLQVRPIQIDEVTKQRPVGTFKLSAYSLDMVGQEMIEPTFDKIQKMADIMGSG